MCWTRSGAACWASTPGCEVGSQPPSPPSDHAPFSFFQIAAVSDVICCRCHRAHVMCSARAFWFLFRLRCRIDSG